MRCHSNCALFMRKLRPWVVGLLSWLHKYSVAELESNQIFSFWLIFSNLSENCSSEIQSWPSTIFCHSTQLIFPHSISKYFPFEPKNTLSVSLSVWTPWPCGWENYWEAIRWHAAGLQWGTVQEADCHAEAAQEALQRGTGRYLLEEEKEPNHGNIRCHGSKVTINSSLVPEKMKSGWGEGESPKLHWVYYWGKGWHRELR